MKTVILSLILFLSSFSFMKAQDTITIYYKKDWTEVSDKNLATYYRKAFPDNNKKWIAHDYYSNNQLQMTGTYKSKKMTVKEGHFIYYHENGRKAGEGDYKDNKYEGFWVYWHENGKKKSEGIYRNDLRQNKWTFWHENEQEKSEGLFVNGELDGKWIYWFDSGEKQAEGVYNDGAKDGVWNYFYKTGQTEITETYKERQLNYCIGFFENGNLKFKGNASYSLNNGEWIYGNVDGKIFMKGNYLNDHKDGEWTRFFPNGDSMKIYYNKGTLVSKQLGEIYKNK